MYYQLRTVCTRIARAQATPPYVLELSTLMQQVAHPECNAFVKVLEAWTAWLNLLQGTNLEQTIRMNHFEQTVYPLMRPSRC